MRAAAFPRRNTLHQIDGIYYAIWDRTGGRAADELSDTELSILEDISPAFTTPGRLRKAYTEYGSPAKHTG
jgi:hypothetical protein